MSYWMADSSRKSDGGIMPMRACSASEISLEVWQGTRNRSWTWEKAPGLVLISFHAFIAPYLWFTLVSPRLWSDLGKLIVYTAFPKAVEHFCGLCLFHQWRWMRYLGTDSIFWLAIASSGTLYSVWCVMLSCGSFWGVQSVCLVHASETWA